MKKCMHIIILAAFLAAGTCSQAQVRPVKKNVPAGSTGAAAGKTGKGSVLLKKVEMSRVRTPDYACGANEASVAPGEWTKVLVVFDTDVEWIDQLEARFYIAVKNQKTGTACMFTGTFVYVEIPKGRNHQAAVFLRPRTTDRYGAAEAAGVEILSQGETVASGTFPDTLKPQWWRTTTLRSVEGYVLERAQTPFVFVAIDNYEVTRAK
jgi:hypothetical protein